MASKVALVLGAGGNIGKSVATLFSASGYKIALASRSGSDSLDADGHLRVKLDLAKPAGIPAAFASVKKQFGAPPQVVVYNAATLSVPPDPDNVFSIPLDDFTAAMTINTLSPWAAAQEAVKAWAESGTAGGRFIYTGNALNKNIIPVANLVTLGAGKSASWHFLEVADALFKPKGHRFFYADERKATGASAGQDLHGDAHAQLYLELAEDGKDVPSWVTFVNGEGIRKF